MRRRHDKSRRPGVHVGSRPRPAAALVLLVMLAASLTACSPKPRPQHAVGVGESGSPVLVVHACPGTTVHGAGIFLNSAEASPSDAGGTWRIVADGETRTELELPMLEPPPPGWTIETQTLQRLADGAEYSSSVWLAGGPDATFVNFTTDKLRSLKSGEVLAHSKGDRLGQPVTRSEFERQAREACE